jgi:hypothetical protein
MTQDSRGLDLIRGTDEFLSHGGTVRPQGNVCREFGHPLAIRHPNHAILLTVASTD